MEAQEMEEARKRTMEEAQRAEEEACQRSMIY